MAASLQTGSGDLATDWLIKPAGYRAEVRTGQNPDTVTLTNGLISRTWRLGSSPTTVRFDNLMTGEAMLRATEPEAILTVDGEPMTLGGLQGQPDRAYLTDDWIAHMTPVPSAFKFEGYTVGAPDVPIPWTPKRHHAPDLQWPPRGQSIAFRYGVEAGQYKGLKALVHYQLYDGIPLLGKYVTLENESAATVRLTSFTLEKVGFTEPDSVVDTPQAWMRPDLTVATDYSFGGMAMNASNSTVYWEKDPAYTTQVNYKLETPCVLEIRPPLGPDAEILPGGHFATFHAYELIHDSADRERRGLAVRKMFRTLAPWATENPIMMHLTSVDPATVHRAIEQAAEVGFEMIVISFWSGLDMEDVSPANIAKFREFHDYAKSKGIEMGGYSLLASRRIDNATDVVDPKTGKPDGNAIFGASPCLGSVWAQHYFEHIKTFMEGAHFDLLEHDGSYPGDVCASTTHPGHRGLADSQWNQFQVIAGFYKWAREKGIYLNVPDNYFLSGSNKTGMGYRESNWSLPRAQQHIHARQNLFDGTWEKTPSMGWMMVPLVEYQGGGPAATIEPLSEHLEDYGLHLANNFGYGAQACYRGPRLYDTPKTRDVVKQWVTWFKRHRDILESDVIHVRRADGRRLDAVLHVNPNLGTKAIAVIYNPSDHKLTEHIALPLYYSGLRGRVMVSVGDGPMVQAELDKDHRLFVRASVEPKQCVWYCVQ